VLEEVEDLNPELRAAIEQALRARWLHVSLLDRRVGQKLILGGLLKLVT
jgi:hypothetical protein